MEPHSYTDRFAHTRDARSCLPRPPTCCRRPSHVYMHHRSAGVCAVVPLARASWFLSLITSTSGTNHARPSYLLASIQLTTLLAARFLLLPPRPAGRPSIPFAHVHLSHATICTYDAKASSFPNDAWRVPDDKLISYLLVGIYTSYSSSPCIGKSHLSPPKLFAVTFPGPNAQVKAHMHGYYICLWDTHRLLNSKLLQQENCLRATYTWHSPIIHVCTFFYIRGALLKK
jgi:hypothetical protein